MFFVKCIRVLGVVAGVVATGTNCARTGFDTGGSGLLGADCYEDLDGDGFGYTPLEGVTSANCVGLGLTVFGGDCDDSDPQVSPVAVEVLDDMIDQNCDGTDAVSCFEDRDGDGVPSTNSNSVGFNGQCDGVGQVPVNPPPTSDDCDDGDPSVYPGAPVLACDGVNYACATPMRYDVPADCPTIQTALDTLASVAGGEVVVASGTYTERVIFPTGLSFTLRSAIGPSTTTIAGTGTGSVIEVGNDGGNTSTIDGFTITGGVGLNYLGNQLGGGMAIFNASPVIRNCIVTQNDDASIQWGGGMYLANSNAQLENLTVSHNEASNGGAGLLVDGISSVTIANSFIYENGWSSVPTGGGGIGVRDSLAGLTTIRNTVIAGNRAGYGGCVGAQNGKAALENIICDSNEGWAADGAGGLHIIISSAVTVVNSVFLNNIGGASSAGAMDGTSAEITSVEYTLFFGNLAPTTTGGVVFGAGTITGTDPNFVDATNIDISLRDYTPTGAPLVNNGHPAQQYNDPDGSQNDIGVYGGPNAPASIGAQ